MKRKEPTGELAPEGGDRKRIHNDVEIEDITHMDVLKMLVESNILGDAVHLHMYMNIPLVSKLWLELMTPIIETHATFIVGAHDIRTGFQIYKNPTHIKYNSSRWPHVIRNKEGTEYITPFPQSIKTIQCVMFGSGEIDHLPGKLVALWCGNHRKITCELPDTLVSVHADEDLQFSFPNNSIKNFSVGALNKNVVVPPKCHTLSAHIDTYDMKHFSQLPESLKVLELTIHDSTEQRDDVGKNAFLKALPIGLSKLDLASETLIEPENIPSELSTLILGYQNRIDSVKSIPQTLTRLSLSDHFNAAIDGLLPPGLEFLYTGHSFNHPVDKLPSNMLSLVLGLDFNKPVNNLPSKLVNLIFGCVNMHYLDQSTSTKEIFPVLCNGYLHTGEYLFDQPLDKLPATLKRLVLYDSRTHGISNLPSSLECFVQSRVFLWNIKDLPKSITTLSLWGLKNSSNVFQENYETIPKCDFPTNLQQLFLYTYTPIEVPDTVRQFHFHRANDAYYDTLDIPENVIDLKCPAEFFEYYQKEQKNIITLRLFGKIKMLDDCSPQDVCEICFDKFPNLTFFQGNSMSKIIMSRLPKAKDALKEI